MLWSLAPLCTVHSVYKLTQLDARAQKLRRKAVTEVSSSNTQCVCMYVHCIYIVCTYLSVAVPVYMYIYKHLLYANKWQIYCNLPQALKNMSLCPQSAIRTDTATGTDTDTDPCTTTGYIFKYISICTYLYLYAV